jgi:hypothetical protein
MTIGWFKRHVHEWEEIDRIHVSPSATKIECSGDGEAVRLAMDTIEHRTSIHLRCKECGDVEHRILIGWAEK